MSTEAMRVLDDETIADDEVPAPPPSERAAVDAWIDYQLAKIAVVRAEILRNTDVAKRRVAMIEDWRDGENAVLLRRIEYIERRVREHTVGYDFGGKRTRKLACGEFGLRLHPASIEIADKPAAVAFSKANSIPVRTTEAPDARELKAWAESTGLVPDGCTITEKHDEFFVKVNGAA